MIDLHHPPRLVRRPDRPARGDGGLSRVKDARLHAATASGRLTRVRRGVEWREPRCLGKFQEPIFLRVADNPTHYSEHSQASAGSCAPEGTIHTSPGDQPGLSSAMERAHAVIAEDGGNAAVAIDCGSSASCWHSAFQIVKKVLQKGDMHRAFLLPRALWHTKYRETLAVWRQIQTPDNRAGRRVIDPGSRP